MKELLLKSYDDSEIFCYLFDEVESPKAVVQICHGMAEHAGRYREFAEFLNSKGYIVFADDHRGHGKTESDKNRGRHKGNMYDKTLKDQVFFCNWLKRQYNLPQIFIGHSYGSFLGQGFIFQGTDVKGIALTGTGLIPGGLAGVAATILAPLRLLLGKWRPAFVNWMADATSKGHYKPENGKALWLTRDKDIRDTFNADPHSGVNMSVSFLHSMVWGISKARRGKNLKKINPNTPIGIFCGDMDPIGMYGKLVPPLAKDYEKRGVKDVELHLYGGARHEVLNETNREEVYQDVLTFIEKCLVK